MKSHLRNNLQRLLAATLCGAMLTFNIACSVTVIPPKNPAHPTVVYLCDYGVHSSLLLPVARGRYVEYLYGDWNWAALCHNSWLDALGAIFWSRQSTLGRRYVTQIPGQAMPIPPDGAKTEIPIAVNGDDCQKVLSEMATRWKSQRATALPEPTNGDFWYVKDSQPYNWLHDCNLNTADSLREMGCQIQGYAVWSKFKVLSAGVPAGVEGSGR